MMKALVRKLMCASIVILLTVCSCSAQYPKHSIDWIVEPNSFLEKNWRKYFAKDEFLVLREAKSLDFALTFDPDTYEVVDVSYFTPEILAKSKGLDAEVSYKVDKQLIDKLEDIFKQHLKIEKVNTLGKIDKSNPECCTVVFFLMFRK